MIQMTINASDGKSNAQRHASYSKEGADTSRRQREVEGTVEASKTTSRTTSTTETGESEESRSEADYYRQNSAGGFTGSSVSDTIPPPSNEFLLGTAFVSFMSFALAEMVFAFIANSQAMKGDAAAMMVDSMTYLFNWIAEHRKNHFDWDAIPATVHETNLVDLDPSRLLQLKQRAYRKMVLHMEIIPPVISVTTLLVVTSVVMYQALLVLMGGPSTSVSHPKLGLMLGFSTFNLALDLMNVFCFARAKHLLGYKTTHEHHHSDHGTSTLTEHIVSDPESGPPQCYVRAEDSSPPTTKRKEIQRATATSHLPFHSLDDPDRLIGHTAVERGETSADYAVDHSSLEDESNRTNLNMCSAYTHVFADTLRSLAVILAATIAELVTVVTAEEADAMAALAVSILILLSLMPFFQGLVESISDLREIHAEERLEVTIQQAKHHSGAFA